MTRVLLLCPENLGRRPAGVGIRFIEFSRLLLAAGHEVTLLTPDGAEIPGCRTASISPSTIRDASERADVAVLQGHVVNEFIAHGTAIPLVVDLYDPFIVENLHYYASRGREVFDHDYPTFTRSLKRGDFFLCASDAQRMFYLGAMLASGRLTPERFVDDPTLQSLIALAPFGVPSPRAARVRGGTHALLFGGIYDWYAPQVAIEAVARLRKEFPGITLTFNTHPNAELPQSAAAETRKLVAKQRLEEVVRFEPWVPYEDREQFYDRFDAAILTFPQSLETDLSMRTRVFDYLWAGLPVITSSAQGTDEILHRYGAGEVVDSLDPDAYADAVRRVFNDEALRGRLISGAAAFTSDHQWERLLAPLLRFCAEPRHDRFRSHEDLSVAPPPRQPLLSRLKRRLRGAF